MDDGPMTQSDELNVTSASEAREKIQEIIDDLNSEQSSTIDPKSQSIDRKMKMLDHIFSLCQYPPSLDDGKR